MGPNALASNDADLVDQIQAGQPESEAALYQLLRERLPDLTLISIGHRSTLAAFHRRRLTLVRDGDRHRVKEAALEPAAE